MRHKFPEDLSALIAHFKKFPGVGTKTAERFAFEALLWEEKNLLQISHLLARIKQTVKPCPACGCLADQDACRFCTGRDESLLCIVASPRDPYAIEETGGYRGLYHVVEHLLSPLDGRHAHALRFERIQERLVHHKIKEVIIAFDSTLEGDTTALYLKGKLAPFNVLVSRLAFGLPVGSSLEYVDGSTLARALDGRQSLP